jgi:hypothetical protein
MPIIESAKPPAAPIPASRQSKPPLGAVTRTIVGATGVGRVANLADAAGVAATASESASAAGWLRSMSWCVVVFAEQRVRSARLRTMRSAGREAVDGGKRLVNAPLDSALIDASVSW